MKKKNYEERCPREGGGRGQQDGQQIKKENSKKEVFIVNTEEMSSKQEKNLWKYFRKDKDDNDEYLVDPDC